MGREKALIDLENRPLISHVGAVLRPIFPDLCVVTGNSQVAHAADCYALADRFENRGPLSGIHAALAHFRAPTFVVACDMPYLGSAFIEFLSQNSEGEAVVPLGTNGAEPLHAVYTPACLPVFEGFLDAEAKMPSMRRVLQSIDTRFVSLEVAREFDPVLRCFINWNTPEDVKETPARRET